MDLNERFPFHILPISPPTLLLRLTYFIHRGTYRLRRFFYNLTVLFCTDKLGINLVIMIRHIFTELFI